MICTIENIETRVSEIENVFLPTIRHDSEIFMENFTQILRFKDQFSEICTQVDNLEALLQRVKGDLNKLEQQVEIAEEELDIPERKLDILLKSINIFAKPRNPQDTNLGTDGNYEPPEIFKAKEYFEQWLVEVVVPVTTGDCSASRLLTIVGLFLF